MAGLIAPCRSGGSRAALSAGPLSALLPASSVSVFSASSTGRRFPSATQSPSSSSSSRPFSTTPAARSKLGRTPLSVPPGVEVVMGEPRAVRSATSYKPVVRKTITVTGPLGAFFSSLTAPFTLSKAFGMDGWMDGRLGLGPELTESCCVLSRNVDAGCARVCGPCAERRGQDCDVERAGSE